MKIDSRLFEKYFSIYMLLLCIFSYGLTIFLGYFWDDWFVMWNFHAMGVRGVFESYVMDRPVHGYLLSNLMQLLGEAPIIWHIANLIMRYIGVVASWFLFRQLWPDHPLENALTASFIAIYPGFTQQPLVIVYILLIHGSFALWGLSTWLMLYSYRNRNHKFILLTILACTLEITHLFISEYFIGLEFIRPLLLGLAFAQVTTFRIKSNWQAWTKQIFLNWLPYLATLIIYLMYRLVFFHSGRPETDSTSIIKLIFAHPVAEISHRVQAALTDPIEVTILAWAQPIEKFFANWLISPRYWWYCLWIAALVAALSWVVFLLLNKPATDKYLFAYRWEYSAAGLGIAAVIFAGIPIWGIGREVTLGYLGDRYSFSFIFGSALLLTAGIRFFLPNLRYRAIAASLIIGLTAGFHIYNTILVFQPDWSNQGTFFSQLTWRVPGLKKGTSIWVMKDPTLMKMEGDYGMAMPLNWIYDPENHSPSLNFWAYPLTGEFLDRVSIFRSGAAVPLMRPLRNISFTGDPRQTIVVLFDPPNCLKIIDPNQKELLEVLPLPTIAQSLAHIDPIVTNSIPATFPENIFGMQSKDWCYYFEQADLARQSSDWKKVVLLREEATQKGLRPFHDSEWLPFIEAYFHLERYDDASQLITMIKDGQLSTSKTLICGFIDRMTTSSDIEKNSAQKEFLLSISKQNLCSSME